MRFQLNLFIEDLKTPVSFHPENEWEITFKILTKYKDSLVSDYLFCLLN